MSGQVYGLDQMLEKEHLVDIYVLSANRHGMSLSIYIVVIIRGWKVSA